jgi:hypothetical protein
MPSLADAFRVLAELRTDEADPMAERRRPDAALVEAQWQAQARASAAGVGAALGDRAVTRPALLLECHGLDSAL